MVAPTIYVRERLRVKLSTLTAPCYLIPDYRRYLDAWSGSCGGRGKPVRHAQLSGLNCDSVVVQQNLSIPEHRDASSVSLVIGEAAESSK